MLENKAVYRANFVVVVGILFSTFLSSCGREGEFRSNWDTASNRTWAGADFWANRLQDWRIHGGRLECVIPAQAERSSGAPTLTIMRTVHLLSRALGSGRGNLTMSVRTGGITDGGSPAADSWTGFLLGAGGSDLDYRAASLVHHLPGRGGGFIAAVDGSGRIVFRDNSQSGAEEIYPLLPLVSQQQNGFERSTEEDIELRLEAVEAGTGYTITLSAFDHRSGDLLGKATLAEVDPSRLVGNVALVSHSGMQEDGTRHWFRDWVVSGGKVEQHDDRRFGPILGAQYTLSRNILKMTAQFPPLDGQDTLRARLEIRPSPNEAWREVASTPIIVPGYTATFRVEDWKSATDVPYRVAYSLRHGQGVEVEDHWEGVVRREPLAKDDFVLAAFTGNHNNGAFAGMHRYWRDVDLPAVRWTRDNLWFPHEDLTAKVSQHSPDLLFFSGDQVYEVASPTRPERRPEYMPLDYLYKWYLWVWAYRDLSRNIPTITIPDDHDVFQGNIWGMGGAPAPSNYVDEGGYTAGPAFANMVERTQTSNLPDPYDPTPIGGGIGVYYTALNYGGISFAILEDRKFKSAPTIVTGIDVRDRKQYRSGIIVQENFTLKRADVEGAVLLGDRQLKFLHDWATDWRGGVVIKAALSQTPFGSLHTVDGKPAPDLDTGGWPQSGRTRALQELRRAHAIHIAGDQHLGTLVQHGLEEWNDSNYSFAVPSISNLYLRYWEPLRKARNFAPGMPEYMGEYLDGMGNKVTFHAVANPSDLEDLTEEELRQPRLELHSKAPGYGIVRFHKSDRTITIECWPRKGDPSDPAGQYPGWPVTIPVEANYGRQAKAFLPTLAIRGMTDPVVQIVDEANGELIYALRIKGTTFQPKVFRNGSYTIRVGDPESASMKELRNIRAVAANDEQQLEVSFP